MMTREKLYLISIFIFAAAALAGCSGAKEAAAPADSPGREMALDHYLEGTLLDQKGDYAKAILEYQDALKFRRDPAIYNSMAKDYSMLGKNDLAVQMGREAVALDPKKRDYHQTLAEIYINAVDLDNAIKEYEEILRIDPGYKEAFATLAHLYRVRTPLKALEAYKKYIEKFGPDAESYFQMAQIYTSMKKLPEATDAMKSMLELDPGNFEMKKALGDLYLRRDSVDVALGIYEDLAETNPDNLELRAAIAHAYLAKQDYDDAVKQFDAVMMKDTLSIDDQIRFGQVFVSFIERDSAVAPYAITMFKGIQKKHPDDWRPYWFLGAMFNIRHEDSLALINFTKVTDLAKWNPDGWVGVASIYYDKNRFNDAVGTLAEAKKYVADEFRIYFLLGISYQRLSQPLDAAAALERALQLNEKSVEAMSGLGMVYEEMKRYADSDSIYERALRLDPRNHLILNNYSYSLAQRNMQLERALQMSKLALSMQPDNQSYLDTYGWIWYKKGDYKKAEEWIKKAVDMGSASAVLQEHLGDVYFRLDQKEKAMEFWRKALQLSPENEELKSKIERGGL